MLMVRHRFSFLLVVLLVLLLTLPLLPEFRPARWVFITLFYGALLSAVLAVAERRKHFLVLGILATIVIVLRAVSLTHPHWLTFRFIGLVGEMLCFGYIVVLILRFVLRADHVTLDMICASLCAYLLIGIVWAQMYILLTAVKEPRYEVFSPSLYQQTDVVGAAGGIEAAALSEAEDEASLDRMFITSIYLSYVTLSTLGYGDIQPVDDLARMCTVVEAIIGQFYLAVLVARLVGLHISSARRDDD